MQRTIRIALVAAAALTFTPALAKDYNRYADQLVERREQELARLQQMKGAQQAQYGNTDEQSPGAASGEPDSMLQPVERDWGYRTHESRK